MARLMTTTSFADMRCSVKAVCTGHPASSILVFRAMPSRPLLTNTTIEDLLVCTSKKVAVPGRVLFARDIAGARGMLEPTQCARKGSGQVRCRHFMACFVVMRADADDEATQSAKFFMKSRDDCYQHRIAHAPEHGSHRVPFRQVYKAPRYE